MGRDGAFVMTYEWLFICYLLDAKESIRPPMLFVEHKRERLSNGCSILIFYVCNEWLDWAIWVCDIIS